MNHEAYLSNQETSNPWEYFSMRELPSSSPNTFCNFFVKEIARSGQMEKIAHFIDQKIAEKPKEYDCVNDFCNDNPNYIKDTWESLNLPQKEALKRYSGFRFSWINSVARGFWDYTKLGPETPELRMRIEQDIQDLSDAIHNAPIVNNDLITYRGTNLDSFHGYNITSLENLKSLKNQFYIERGFTSTALTHEKSFSNTKPSGFWNGDSNIEIAYHLPANSHDYIGLFSKDFSYSPTQNEVLLDKCSLSFVSDVKIKNGHALIDMLLIPRELYDSLSG